MWVHGTTIDLQVQLLPKGALLLANAPSSEKRDRVMRYLPIWAPGTGKDAAALLSSELAVQKLNVQMAPCQQLLTIPSSEWSAHAVYTCDVGGCMLGGLAGLLVSSYVDHNGRALTRDCSLLLRHTMPMCCAAAEGLELLCGPTGGEAAVRSYAIKCLFNTHPEKVRLIMSPWSIGSIVCIALRTVQSIIRQLLGQC
jgi:hypothetical protein